MWEGGCLHLGALEVVGRNGRNLCCQCEFQDTVEGGTGAGPRRPPGETRDIQRAA
jgi:hypothetical protein